MKAINGRQKSKFYIFMILIMLAEIFQLHAGVQQKHLISGKLLDTQNTQAVSFATIALRRTTDSTLITGTASNIDGEFTIGPVPDGSYSLIISAIGYEGAEKYLELTEDLNTGIIWLQEKSVSLSEVIVAAERVKAKAEADRTTYFINEKIYTASNSGIDVLTFIPGIQVDLMKNISLNGSGNIIIMVDGKERDRNFISQLDPLQIDKVEVVSSPNSRYDGSASGVINLILKRKSEPGMNGKVYLELPVSKSLIYISPDYNLNFSFNKMNFYTSYDGNLSYFDLNESSMRKMWDSRDTIEIISTQSVRQKYWSHRFHYGVDYIINEKNQLNFYAFYNPYSSEHDGNIEMTITGDQIADKIWTATKDDKDINHSAFYSLYYRHGFAKPGSQLAIDLNYSGFKAENSTTYTVPDGLPGTDMNDLVNSVRPGQNSVNFKIDYTSQFTDKVKLDAGFKSRSQFLQDRLSDDFKYRESVLALYGTITYSNARYTVSTGVRAEESIAGLSASFSNNQLAFLPGASLNYKINSKQNLNLSYRRTVNRPNLYDLNPYTFSDDPFAIRSGNAELKQEYRQNLSIDYSNSIGNNFISSQLFIEKRTDAINKYMFINDDQIFETRIGNAGEILNYGIQLSGAIKPHGSVALNPYIKVFRVSTEGNSLARRYGIIDRGRVAFESGLSAIVTFRYDIVGSMQFRYSSPGIDIQGKSFSDALYFIAIEKTFKKRFKAGIKSALPFSKSFTYQGYEISGEEFYSHSEGKVLLTSLPVWLTFSFQFKSGKESGHSDRTNEDVLSMPKKGF